MINYHSFILYLALLAYDRKDKYCNHSSEKEEKEENIYQILKMFDIK